MAEKESPTAKLLFGVTGISTSLLSTLESQFSMIMDGQKAGSIVDYPLYDQWETLRVSLKNTATSLLLDAQAKDEILNSHDKVDSLSQSSRYGSVLLIVSFVLLLYFCLSFYTFVSLVRT